MLKSQNQGQQSKTKNKIMAKLTASATTKSKTTANTVTAATKTAQSNKAISPIPQLEYINASIVHAHPLNPRPKSEFYHCNVDDGKVEDLIASIQGNGYDMLEPVQVRRIGETYQIIAGHHRYCALIALNMKEIPCVVLNIDEVEGAIRLVSRQGKSIEPWDLAQHAAELCKKQAICSQVEYAKKTGYNPTLVSKWVRAIEVMDFTGGKKLGVTACASIARAPQDKWQELVDTAIKDKLGTREIDELVAKIQGKTNLEPATAPQLNAVLSPEDLGPQKTVELEQSLKTSNIPSNVPKGMFAPIGVQAKLREWNAPSNTSFDLILIDRSTLREDLDDAVRKACELVSKSGRLIIICEPRHTIDTVVTAEDFELSLEQKLIWFRGDGNRDDIEGRLWPNSYREILVFKPKDLIGWFDAELTIKHFSLTPGDVFKLAASAGGGISAILAELLFRTYVPPNGSILIPGAFETQAILAGYRLNQHVTWLENNEQLFQTMAEGLPC
jgi:ParB/RepB/Spo0J family partition protein